MPMVVGPAMTMGVASLFMGIFAVVNVMGPNGSGNIMQALPHADHVLDDDDGHDPVADPGAAPGAAQEGRA